MANNFIPESGGKSTTYSSDDVNGVHHPIANSSSFKTFIYSASGYTYLCESYQGAVSSSAVWRITRIDSSGNINHAGTSASSCGKFDQVATSSTIVAGLGYY